MNARRPRPTHLAVAALILCPLLGLLAAACSPKHHAVVGLRNNPPTANAGGDKIDIDTDLLVALTGTGSDPDSNGISYQWTRVLGPAVTINNANTANASFTVPAMTTASWTFRLTVTDDGVPPVSTTDDIIVTSRVTWANTVAALMADRPGISTTGCTSCHFAGNSTGRIPFDNYNDVSTWQTTIRARIASGTGNMRQYLLAGEPEAITAWINNGTPQTN